MTRQAVTILTVGLLATPIAAQAEDAVVMLNVHNARSELCPLIVIAADGSGREDETMQKSK